MSALTVARTVQIYLDERGVAWVEGANTKVWEIARDKVACGWDAEEIHAQHPHLSLAQIHAALSYYYAHRDVIDAQLAQMDAEIDREVHASGESPFRKRMRADSRLP